MLDWKPDEIFSIDTAFEDMNISENEKLSLRKHLKDHKFFIETNFGIAIEDSEALASWSEYVRDPAYFFFKKYKFEEKTGIAWPEALKVITDRWHYLKEQTPKENKMISIGDAVRNITGYS
jgi:hypothetical protein